MSTTTNEVEKATNAALYAAADKAGFGDVLRRYHGEVFVVASWTGAGVLSAHFEIDAEIVNADHECDREVPASLRPAVERARVWLAKFIAAKYPWIQTRA